MIDRDYEAELEQQAKRLEKERDATTEDEREAVFIVLDERGLRLETGQRTAGSTQRGKEGQ